MSAPLSTTQNDDTQVALPTAGPDAAPSIPRLAQRDRDGGNSKLGTFGVSRTHSHPILESITELNLHRSNLAWLRCSRCLDNLHQHGYSSPYLHIHPGRCHHGCHQCGAGAHHISLTPDFYPNHVLFRHALPRRQGRALSWRSNAFLQISAQKGVFHGWYASLMFSSTINASKNVVPGCLERPCHDQIHR